MPSTRTPGRSSFADLIAEGPGERLKGARSLPLSLIDHNPAQFRQSFDEQTIRELADSIAEQGLIEPIVVRPKGERFEIVAGERRYRALLLLAGENNPKADPVPCLIREMDDTEAALTIAAENLQREDFTVADEAVMYERLISLLGLNPERSDRELGRRLGVDNNRISRVRRIARYPHIAADVASGRLTFMQAVNQVSGLDLRDETPPDERDLVPAVEVHEYDLVSPRHNPEPPFTEQHVREHTRLVPASAWQPFYTACNSMGRLWENEPIKLLPSMAAVERQEIRVKALQAREQLDRLIDALAQGESDAN